MVVKYQKHVSIRATGQTDPIPGKNMVANSAGGYSFAVDNWTRLDRFLLLGAEGGTYYIKEKELTIDNAKSIEKCIKEDGIRVVNRIVEISDEGRAPKNDPALFVLAMCSGMGNDETKKAAFDALPKVARIGTHIFAFMDYVKSFRGRGRALRNAVARWYQDKDADKLAYQMVKYQQRDGWSHRDILRLVKPKPKNKAHDVIYGWVTKGELKSKKNVPEIIEGHIAAQKAENVSEVVKIIEKYKIPRESIPTQYLTDSKVWGALLDAGMPITAMIRNLGNMSKCGLLAPLSDASKTVIKTVTNEEILKKGRVHPITILVALKTYAQGHGMRGSGAWEVNQKVADALDDAYYKAFKFVEPTNKRFILGCDVSYSMSAQMGNIPLTCCEAVGAMAMVTLHTEPECAPMAFCDRFVPIKLTTKMRLDEVAEEMQRNNFGSTDCSLPMLWAMENNIKADVFVVYTDNETYAGRIHPCQALVQYRQKFGIPAKLIVVGMTASEFTIADPNDGGMLDIVGMDTSVPQIMADFCKN